jgi:hypothetical protein
MSVMINGLTCVLYIFKLVNQDLADTGKKEMIMYSDCNIDLSCVWTTDTSLSGYRHIPLWLTQSRGGLSLVQHGLLHLQ